MNTPQELAYESMAAGIEDDEPIPTIGARLGWVVVSMKADWETVFPAG